MLHVYLEDFENDLESYLYPFSSYLYDIGFNSVGVNELVDRLLNGRYCRDDLLLLVEFFQNL